MTAAPPFPSQPTMLAGAYRFHVRQTLWIATPLALSLLSEMAMGLISTLMLGGIGDRALAAGGLGTNLFFTVLIVLQGVLAGVGVLAASALGAGRPDDVPRIYWTGVALACLLAGPLFALLSDPVSMLRALGEPPVLAADVGQYLRILRWAVPAGVVGIGMMRQFLPAVGLQRVLLWVLPAGVGLHALLNLILVRGAFGLAGQGFAGSAWAIVITLSVMSAAMLAVLHGGMFPHFVRFVPPHLAIARHLLRLGLPTGVSVGVEVGLFLATGLLAGRFGAMVLAAHMIALSVISVTFMVPLAISQAANVRVARYSGAGDGLAARRAGFCAIGLSIGFMLGSALLLKTAPHLVIALYLGQATPANAATQALAARLLGVAGVFQLFDGTQVAATGALRGLQDVRVPMLVASFGYWGVGFGAAWFMAFDAGFGIIGLWWGLCAGLAAVAAGLTWRFEKRSKQGLLF